MNEHFSELLEAAQSRTVTVRTADGHALVRTKLLHAAAALVAGVIIAPRLTAAASVGALLKGFSLSVESSTDKPVAA